MGVLKCDRRGCENIMCDRLSRTYGYICSDCFQELVSKGSKTNIESFMDSSKPVESEEDSYEFFNEEFSSAFYNFGW